MDPQEIGSVTPPDTNKPVDDLPMAITKAMEEVEQRQTQPAEPAAPTTQPRAPDGKFAPKDVPAAPAAAPASPPSGVVSTPPAPGTAPTTPAAAPAGAPSAPSTDDAPASWKPELKEKWAALPSEVRAEVSRREKEVNTALQGAAERTRMASAVMAEFEPYNEVLQAEGATPIAAIRTLLQTAYALRAAAPEYRKAIFLQLAQQYDVDLTTGFDARLAQAQGQVTHNEITQREQAARAEAYQHQQAAAVLDAFRAAPGHEDFDIVKPIMGQLMATGVCADLETAYQQARVLSPQLRDKILDERARQIAAHNAQEEARRRAAASSVGGGLGATTGSPSQSARGVPGGDVRSALSDAYDRAMGG